MEADKGKRDARESERPARPAESAEWRGVAGMGRDRRRAEAIGGERRPVGKIANDMASHGNAAANFQPCPVVRFLREAPRHEGPRQGEKHDAAEQDAAPRGPRARGNLMLRITVMAAPDALRVLKLEGHVDREGGALLERECASWIAAGAAIALDLSSVRFVDRSGTAALGRLGRAGVEIRCRSGVVASVLESEGIEIVDTTSGD